MTIDLMVAAGAQLASITGAVWVATEAIGRYTSRSKILIALALGPLLAVIAYALGFLTALPDCPFVLPLCKWASAAFAGLITTLLAKGFHDLLGDRIIKAVPGLK